MNPEQRGRGHGTSNDHSTREQETQRVPSPWHESDRTSGDNHVHRDQTRPLNLNTNQNIGQLPAFTNHDSNNGFFEIHIR